MFRLSSCSHELKFAHSVAGGFVRLWDWQLCFLANAILSVVASTFVSAMSLFQKGILSRPFQKPSSMIRGPSSIGSKAFSPKQYDDESDLPRNSDSCVHKKTFAGMEIVDICCEVAFMTSCLSFVVAMSNVPSYGWKSPAVIVPFTTWALCFGIVVVLISEKSWILDPKRIGRSLRPCIVAGRMILESLGIPIILLYLRKWSPQTRSVLNRAHSYF